MKTISWDQKNQMRLYKEIIHIVLLTSLTSTLYYWVAPSVRNSLISGLLCLAFSYVWAAEKQTSKDRGAEGHNELKDYKIVWFSPWKQNFLLRQVESRPFKLHPIFSFEKMGAFVTLKKIG